MEKTKSTIVEVYIIPGNTTYVIDTDCSGSMPSEFKGFQVRAGGVTILNTNDIEEARRAIVEHANEALIYTIRNGEEQVRMAKNSYLTLDALPSKLEEFKVDPLEATLW